MAASRYGRVHDPSHRVGGTKRPARPELGPARPHEGVAQGGALLQGWLDIAKQRALRDQAPRGLRLYVSSDPNLLAQVGNIVTEAQYIDQPDDFTGGTFTTDAADPSNKKLIFGNVD